MSPHLRSEHLKLIERAKFRALSVRDLSSDEIVLTEELVRLKLLTKLCFKNDSIYTYKVTDVLGERYGVK